MEGPFAAIRLRTTAAKRFKWVESVTALIRRLPMVTEKRFRRDLTAGGAVAYFRGPLLLRAFEQVR